MPSASSYVKEVDGLTSTIRKTYSAGRKQLRHTDDCEWYAEHAQLAALGSHLDRLGGALGSASITTTADGTWFSELRYSAFGETR